MNILLKEIINKIEEGTPLVKGDLALLQELGEEVNDVLIDENVSDYYTYRTVIKVENRYFSIVYEVRAIDRRFEIDSIYEAEEVKPIETQVTITEYVPI